MATCSFVKREADDQEKLTLAKFAHGRLQRKSDGSWRKAPSFKLLKSTETEERRKRSRRIMVAEADSMQYVGQNYGEQASKANSMCKYLVGVFDKKKGKMKVYDAQLLELHPWLGRKEKKEDQKKEELELSYAQKKDRLTEAFGSSRKQRAMESRLRSKIGSEALESVAAQAISHAGIIPDAPPNLTEEEDDLLPPCDRNATIPANVYKLEDLIASGHQRILQPLAEELIEGAVTEALEWKKTKKYPCFVLSRLTGLQKVKEEKQVTQAVCLLYVSYLMRLHLMKAKEISQKSCLSGVPPIIRAHILQVFTQMTPTPDGQQEKRLLPKRLKDKLLSYILVLCQLIDNFQTDVAPLCEDLGVSIKKLLTHARAIGCKSSTQVATAESRKRSRFRRGPDGDGEYDADFAIVSKITYIELSAPFKKQEFRDRQKFGKRK